MSQWRRKALEQLPEWQSTIASPSVQSPADLWMELWFRFDELCRRDPAPIDLLSRIWEYAKWCDAHENDDVQFGVINYFFENIEGTRRQREVFPMFMSQQELEQVTGFDGPKKKTID